MYAEPSTSLVNIPLKREQPGERFSAAITQELYRKPKKMRWSPATKTQEAQKPKPQPRKSDQKPKDQKHHTHT